MKGIRVACVPGIGPGSWVDDDPSHDYNGREKGASSGWVGCLIPLLPLFIVKSQAPSIASPRHDLKHWGRPIRGQIVGYGSGHPLPTPVDEFEAPGPWQSSWLLHRVNHPSYMTPIVPGPELWRPPRSRQLLPRTTLQSVLRYQRAARSHDVDERADPVGLRPRVGIRCWCWTGALLRRGWL